MATGLDTGHWAWTNRWSYADQVNDLPHARRSLSRTTSQPLAGATATSTSTIPTIPTIPPPNATIGTVNGNGSATTRSLPTGDGSGALTSTTSSLSSAGASISSAHRSRATTGGPSRIPHVGTSTSLMSLYTEAYTSHGGLVSTQPPTRDITTMTMKKLRQRNRGLKKAPETLLHHHVDPYYHESEEKKNAVKPQERSFRLWGRINPAHCVNPYMSEHQRTFVNPQEYRDPMDTTHNMRIIRKDYKEALARAENIQKTHRVLQPGLVSRHN